MRPVVAEVVHVAQLLARLAQELVEADVELVDTLLAFLDVVVGDEVRPTPRVAEVEAVQVRVGPAHRGLQDLVNVAEAHLPGNGQAAPHGRLGVVQGQPDGE